MLRNCKSGGTGADPYLDLTLASAPGHLALSPVPRPPLRTEVSNGSWADAGEWVTLSWGHWEEAAGRCQF
jgi:hypothetical protein